MSVYVLASRVDGKQYKSLFPCPIPCLDLDNSRQHRHTFYRHLRSPATPISQKRYEDRLRLASPELVYQRGSGTMSSRRDSSRRRDSLLIRENLERLERSNRSLGDTPRGRDRSSRKSDAGRSAAPSRRSESSNQALAMVKYFAGSTTSSSRRSSSTVREASGSGGRHGKSSNRDRPPLSRSSRHSDVSTSSRAPSVASYFSSSTAPSSVGSSSTVREGSRSGGRHGRSSNRDRPPVSRSGYYSETASQAPSSVAGSTVLSDAPTRSRFDVSETASTYSTTSQALALRPGGTLSLIHI